MYVLLLHFVHVQHNSSRRHHRRNSQSTSSHRARNMRLADAVVCVSVHMCEHRARVSSLSANKHDYVHVNRTFIEGEKSRFVA